MMIVKLHPKKITIMLAMCSITFDYIQFYTYSYMCNLGMKMITSKL